MLIIPQTAEQWMQYAYELAVTAAERDEVPVGAILVQGAEVVGVGANRRERSGRTVAHAEIMALEDFNRRHAHWRVPPDTSLFVTAEPCLMCTGALLWARVDHIYFGCSDPKNAGLQRLLPLIRGGVYDHRFSEVRGGVLGASCSQLLSGYFRRKRRETPAPPPFPT